MANDHDSDDYTPPKIKPSRRGLLHKKLGIAQGTRIPLARLLKAKKSSSPAERKEANFAINFREP